MSSKVKPGSSSAVACGLRDRRFWHTAAVYGAAVHAPLWTPPLRTPPTTNEGWWRRATSISESPREARWRGARRVASSRRRAEMAD